MKRKIAIRATVGVIVCVFVFGGCSGQKKANRVDDEEFVLMLETETETETEKFETATETEIIIDTEVVTEEERFSEFSGVELVWIEGWLVEKKLGHSLDDVERITCLGVCRVPTESGLVIREDQRTYAVKFRNGSSVMVNIPVAELEEGKQ